jgi:hypothetical protein
MFTVTSIRQKTTYARKFRGDVKSAEIIDL